MTAQNPHFSHPKYRPDIDGLRAVAVLAVVAFHAFPTSIKGGFIGVDIFFVISGFLISTIIFENLDRGTFSFSEFYARRIKRIFPALSLVLIACLVFAWFSLLPDELNQLGKHVVAGAGFVSNLVLWGESGYFDNSAETKPLLHLWSLGIEEQFYIVWPLLLWFAWKRRLNLFALTIFFAFASFVLNIWWIRQDAIATFYSPFSRFWELLCGSLLAWCSLYKANLSLSVDSCLNKISIPSPFKRLESVDPLVLSNVYSVLGVSLLGLGFFIINKDLRFPGYLALIPVLGAVLIISGGPKAWINRNVLSSKLFVWFGLISFPLYLWHWPILSFGRIIYFETPPLRFRLAAVIVSILLAWLTVKLVERPFRFGGRRSVLKVSGLSATVITLALVGVVVHDSNFSVSHSFSKLSVKRKGEFAIGSSLAWYQGKEDWLFLGNAYDSTVEKLKLAIKPSELEVAAVMENFSKIAETAAKHGTKTVLILGPNKSSIYPEYLPDGLDPSPVKYSSFFLDKLKTLPGLTVYDPTDDLFAAKKTEGLLYWMTDTHWNSKGAFLTYSGFSKLLGLPIPKLDFKEGSTHSGDIIRIAKLKDFPLHSKDNWDVVWQEQPVWTEKEISNEQKTSFGVATISTNEKPLSNKYVWVVGDSFSGALKQYFNATFKEVRYVGHWSEKLNNLSSNFSSAERKPDLIVIVRVERSF